MIKIGNISLGEFPLLLAPMEDVSDPPFRALCKKYGADMMYTEFISSEGLIRDADKSVQKLDIYDSERPIGIQIFGDNIESMKEAARISEKAKPEVLDINYGCPVKKVACRGAGAGILLDLDKMQKMTKEIVRQVKIPVTVKTRLGWDDKSIKIVEVAERLQDVGIQALTIHGRTRKQMYKGEANWEYIAEVKNNNRIKESPSIANRISSLKKHIDFSIRWKGEKLGLIEMRRHYNNYFRGIDNFKPYRLKLVHSEKESDSLEILEEINTVFNK